MKKILLSLALAIFSMVAFAQDHVIPVGEIKKVSVRDGRLDIITTHAYVSIQVYSPTIIRVRIANQPLGDDFSYPFIPTPRPPDPGSAYPPKPIALPAPA